MDDPALAQLCGWVNHPDIPALAADAPKLADIAPHLYLAVDPSAPVLLYKAWVDVLGSFPGYVAQEIGDCTSFGTGHSVDLTEAVQIAIGKQPQGYKETCTEAIYGLGREVGGMLGRGDGCFGSAVTDAVIKFGVVPRDAVGAYSGQRARQWGRSGVPDEIRTSAALHKIKMKALLKTCDDVDAGLFSGYVGIACSNVGFNSPRDADGVCRQRGSWAHCMSYSGRRVKNGRRQYCIDQSWGPDQPQGPLSDGQPPFSFWIDEADMQAILDAQDSYVLSVFDGYPGQPLPPAWTLSDALGSL